MSIVNTAMSVWIMLRFHCVSIRSFQFCLTVCVCVCACERMNNTWINNDTFKQSQITLLFLHSFVHLFVCLLICFDCLANTLWYKLCPQAHFIRPNVHQIIISLYIILYTLYIIYAKHLQNECFIGTISNLVSIPYINVYNY